MSDLVKNENRRLFCFASLARRGQTSFSFFFAGSSTDDARKMKKKMNDFFALVSLYQLACVCVPVMVINASADRNIFVVEAIERIRIKPQQRFLVEWPAGVEHLSVRARERELPLSGCD